MKLSKILIASMLSAAFVATPAHADKLDDIMASGTLRCAVTLDFPPMGSRDKDNNPIGFDVDTCNDLAKALGVKAEIVDTPFPDRIPALVSGRADVGVASTSDTLERARTVGFSIPYFAFTFSVLTREGTGIQSYESMKGKKVGSTAGTYEAIRLEQDVKKWNDPNGSFRAYQSVADLLLALAQGQIDGTALTSTVTAATVKDNKFKSLVMGDEAPYDVDYVALIALRGDQGVLNYMDLFVNQQVRTGRYQELYDKWIGAGTPPNLTVKGVYR